MGQILSFLPMTKNQTGKNFNIVSYISEDALPSIAKNGDIAVISAVAVKKINIQSNEPLEPTVGDLWITYRPNGKHPTSTENIIIYPQNAYQYTDNWVKVPMFIWADEKWNSSVIYLLNAEDSCIENTGGWDTYGTTSSMAQKIDEGFQVSAANTGYQKSGIQTKNAINVSDYSRIVFVGRVIAYYSYFGTLVGIQTEKASNVDGITNNAAYTSIPETDEFNIVVDVSSYTGEYYVGITSGMEMIVTQIYME